MVPGVPVQYRFDHTNADARGRVAWSDGRVGMGVQVQKVDRASPALIDNFVDAHFFTNRKA